MGYIFYFIPIILLASVLYPVIKALNYQFNSVTTTGKVRIHPSGEKFHQDNIPTGDVVNGIPIVEYYDHSSVKVIGKPQHFASKSHELKIGDDIELKFLKKDPSRFILTRNNNFDKAYAFALLTIAFLIFFYLQIAGF